MGTYYSYLYHGEVLKNLLGMLHSQVWKIINLSSKWMLVCYILQATCWFALFMWCLFHSLPLNMGSRIWCQCEIFYIGNFQNLLKSSLCCEIIYLSSEGLLGEELLLLTTALSLLHWYAIKTLFQMFNPFPVQLCHGVVNCMVEFLKGLLISISVKMVYWLSPVSRSFLQCF
jgi:hypothetical protein